MSRSDRTMILAAIVALALVIGSVVSAVALLRPAPDPRFHAPETEVERQVTTAAHLRVFHVEVRDGDATLYATSSNEGLTLRDVGAWRVVGHRRFGLA
jgi:hypothetical protein